MFSAFSARIWDRSFGIFLLFQASSVYLHGMGLDVSIGL